MVQKLAEMPDFKRPSGLKEKQNPVLYMSLNPHQRESGIHLSLAIASNPIATVCFCIIADKFYLYM